MPAPPSTPATAKRSNKNAGGDDEEGSSGWRWKHNKKNSTICVGPDGRTGEDYLIDWMSVPENWAAYSDSNNRAKFAATVIYKWLLEKKIKNFDKAKASGVQDRIQKMKKAFDEVLAIQKPTGEGVTEDDLARDIETWEAKIKEKCPFFFTLLPSLKDRNANITAQSSVHQMGDIEVSITPSMARRVSSRSNIEDQSVGMEDEGDENDDVFSVRGTRANYLSTNITSNHGVADEPTSGARGAGSLSNGSRARASLNAQDTPTSGKGRRGNASLNEQLQGLFKDHSTANIKGRKEIAEQQAQAVLEQYKVAEQARRFEGEVPMKNERLKVEDTRYEARLKIEQEEREAKRKRDDVDAHWRNVKAQREELRAQDEMAAKKWEFERELIKEYVADGDTREEAKRKAIEETKRRFTYD
ncbi:hypothetical protein L198_01742 [Cryptococcus wingfieldii CBS 7118]|uniref:Uncharacterized protein n=1 Tax=Cryptococcus wingfieldii CBS 7118 TaxID=1295528 RepID=A0A1E3K0B6_9TREE|nr:hypothetical protein L198_01742 [Cryptococcus wingfieldii CBS 7118]ODO06509.1 hypothetical protein L198_01742 [Cryptococcus wingfieldii CBS 7118]